MIIIVIAVFDSRNNRLEKYHDHQVIISGTVSENAIEKDGTLRLVINNLYFNYSTKSIKSQVYVMLSSGKGKYERSDKITLKGVMKEGFGNYSGSIYRPEIIEHSKPSPPDFALKIREWFSENIKNLFGANESALALGYMVGDKALMTEELTQSLRVVGLSHMVVTSGFHLSILADFIKRLFGKISRAAITIGTTILVFVFMAITGFGASMLRAGLMCLINLYAWYFGRKFHPGRLLLYVAAITLLIDSASIMNVGWQLSFAAFAGIIFISPVLTKFLYGSHSPGFIMSSLITSISAQLLCLPLGIYYFGMFSAVGIFVSLIITPTIAAAMLLFLLSGTIFSPIAPMAEMLIRIHLALISWVAEIPWASMNVAPNNPMVLLVFIPVAVLFIILKCVTKYDFRPRYALDNSPKYGKIYSC